MSLSNWIALSVIALTTLAFIYRAAVIAPEYPRIKPREFDT